jgi:hypothetical protein
MKQQTSLIDRIGYGAVMLFLGLIIGSIAGIAGFGLSTPPHFNVIALLFTLLVFFAIGFKYLDRGADFVALCFTSVLVLLSLVTASVLYEPKREDFSPTWCLFALIAWLAAITFILLNF